MAFSPINTLHSCISFMFFPFKELFRNSTVTSLTTMPCVCLTSPMKTLRWTLSEVQTMAAVLATAHEELPARCHLVRESPPNTSMLTSLSDCLCPHSTWVPSSAKRAPPSATSQSRPRASE